MNRAVHDAAREWLSAGRIAVVVEVIDFKGSVPRETGTRMLVAGDAVVGTIGGGHLELQAIEHARTMLAGGSASSRTSATSRSGPRSASAAAACCGCAGRRCRRPRCRRGRRPTRAFTCSCTAPATSAAPSRACWPASTAACSGSTSATASFRPSASPPHIERVCVEPVEAEVAVAPRGACFLVLTHSHDLDLRITEAILRRGDFAYLGLIGSATKRARFVHRFEERGIAADALARMTCPIGVPGIAGKEPEVIAMAVVAQLLQQSPA